MAQVLADCLHLERSKWTRAEQTRVGEVLATLGYMKKDRGSTVKPRYVYALRERAGRGGLMNSAPTPHLLRTRYGMRKSLTGKGRTQSFRTSAPRVHVCA
jgi:hypothetical protein